MAGYVQWDTTLRSNQLKRLKAWCSREDKDPLTIRLSAQQCNENSGDDTLLIPASMMTKIQKSGERGLGCTLKLSKNFRNKNRELLQPILTQSVASRKRMFAKGKDKDDTEGGSLPLAGVIASAVMPAVTDVANKTVSRIFDDIFGSGVGHGSKSTDEEKKKAIEVLTKSKYLGKVKRAKTMEDLDNILDKVIEEEKLGEGLEGSGWKEALGWVATFLNPFSLITVPARLAYEGYKTVKGKGTKQLDEMVGTGIRFL